jgi:disulfide bond formation protein DsbB
LRKYLAHVAWAQTIIATSGSLVFSEVMGYVPCALCWYQRILMYPLVIIIAVGILNLDDGVRKYVLPLSFIGYVIAFYHNFLYFGFVTEETLNVCTTGVSCTTRWFEWFGFISIPQLSLIAFTVVILAMLWYRNDANLNEELDETSDDEPASPKSSNARLTVLSLIVAAATIIILTMGMVKSNAERNSGSSFLATPEAEILTTPASTVATDAAEATLIADGTAIYNRNCSTCHGASAVGIPNLGSTLVHTDFMTNATDDELRTLIVNGRAANDPLNITGLAMPPKGGNPALTDLDISAIIAYLRALNRT